MRALELKVPPVAQFLIAAAAMWLLRALFPSAVFSFPGQLLAASVVLLAGGLVGLAAVRAFLQAGTSANPLRPDQAVRLVRGGIYARTRNPMYLALILALAAWGLWLGSALSLLPVPLFIVALNRLQVAPEERALEARFGAEFVNYKRKVRRWL
ncbi:MAG TPA: isoprenylcysteine carboxylmethyltransferase family protein [Gammaproteobacteria bacterium]|nr:isoprenylcysteine carboxylmethyltransferase family protein [Gammaproteobacteria bacterium]